VNKKKDKYMTKEQRKNVRAALDELSKAMVSSMNKGCSPDEFLVAIMASIVAFFKAQYPENWEEEYRNFLKAAIESLPDTELN